MKTKKIKALVTAEVCRDLLEKELSDRIDFTYKGYAVDHRVLPPNELKNTLGDYQILISEYDTISEEILNAAIKLKLIVCCRGGVRSVIDLDTATKRGIQVFNTAGRNANAVTDMVIGYLFCLTRNIVLTNELIHSRKLTMNESTKPKEYKDTVWGLDDKSPFIVYRGRSLDKMTVGLVGFGHAGKLMAQKLHMFSMKILAYDPFSDFKDKPEYVTRVNFQTILEQSDVISLHCTLTDKSRGMFSAKEFDMMKEGSFFINTSRGELINEEDLVEALNHGRLAGAALDVTRKEPIPADSPLLQAKKLILTPHIAGSSQDVQECGTKMVVDIVQNYLAKGEI